MAKSIRAVIDTNVLISGSFGLKNSPSSQILHAIHSQKIIFATSASILQEIQDVISRERIVKLTKMSKQEIRDFMDKLIERSDITEGRQLPNIVGRDVKDDKFLACAYEAKADYLITGDKDLLILKQYEGTKIIKPRDFVNLLLKWQLSN